MISAHIPGAEVETSEDREQMEFVKWFRRSTHGQNGVRIFAIPNGGSRNPATALRLKATGVSPGIPDLMIPAWGLWVEMKRKNGGVVSSFQSDWHKYLGECGYTVVICCGADAAIKFIEDNYNG